MEQVEVLALQIPGMFRVEAAIYRVPEGGVCLERHVWRGSVAGAVNERKSSRRVILTDSMTQIR